MIMLSAMDMEIAKMNNVIVIVTGVVRWTVQVAYQAHLFIYIYVIRGCGQKEMGTWSGFSKIFGLRFGKYLTFSCQ